MLGRLTLRRAIAPLLAALAMPAAVQAAGGTWCDASDGNLDFHFKASHSRDGSGAWFGIEGHVAAKGLKLPAHLARFEIRDDLLTQRWVGTEGVLLEIQKYDADPYIAVRLTVSTKPVEEASYAGTYELRVTTEEGAGEDVLRTGKVICSGD